MTLDGWVMAIFRLGDRERWMEGEGSETKCVTWAHARPNRQTDNAKERRVLFGQIGFYHRHTTVLLWVLPMNPRFYPATPIKTSAILSLGVRKTQTTRWGFSPLSATTGFGSSWGRAAECSGLVCRPLRRFSLSGKKQELLVHAIALLSVGSPSLSLSQCPTRASSARTA